MMRLEQLEQELVVLREAREDLLALQAKGEPAISAIPTEPAVRGWEEQLAEIDKALAERTAELTDLA